MNVIDLTFDDDDSDEYVSAKESLGAQSVELSGTAHNATAEKCTVDSAHTLMHGAKRKRDSSTSEASIETIHKGQNAGDRLSVDVDTTPIHQSPVIYVNSNEQGKHAGPNSSSLGLVTLVSGKNKGSARIPVSSFDNSIYSPSIQYNTSLSKNTSLQGSSTHTFNQQSQNPLQNYTHLARSLNNTQNGITPMQLIESPSVYSNTSASNSGNRVDYNTQTRINGLQQSRLSRDPALYQQQSQASTPSDTRTNNTNDNLHIIGKLRSIVVISTSSRHFTHGDQLCTNVSLRINPSDNGTVDVIDNGNGILGTMEKSLAKKVAKLISSGHIKARGFVFGLLRNKYVAQASFNFYARYNLALEILRTLDQLDIHLDQSSEEAQSTLNSLDIDSNAYTKDMGYSSIHPTMDTDGLIILDSNSDSSLPSVFRPMGLHPTRAEGPNSGLTISNRPSAVIDKLPTNLRVDRNNDSIEDPKIRLAAIKSAFVTLQDLPEMDSPPQVTTKLRRHQKQALFFMIYRETDGVDVAGAGMSGDVAEQVSKSEINIPKLWLDSNTANATINISNSEYRHAITGIKCIGRPNSILGGILADDMGLGKTLSVISLIFKSPPRWKLGASTNSDGSLLVIKHKTKKNTIKRSFRRARSHHTKKLKESKKGKKSKKGKEVAAGLRFGLKRRILENSDDDDDDNDDFVRDANNLIIPKKKLEMLFGDDFDSSNESESESESGDESESTSGSTSESLSSDQNSNDSESDNGSLLEPLTPPPEFENLQTKNKELCERRLADNYHGRYYGGSLIVCPLSTMSNWEEQVKSHVKPNTLKVYLYHGPGRSSNPKELCSYDVVLTTYNVLQIEYAREIKQLVVSGDTESESESAIIIGDEDGLGQGDKDNDKWYQVPDAPYVSPLQAVHWHRVVLDEAHTIKERRTGQSLSAFSLTSSRRWCLTGTPIQNRIDDLYSLLRFLHATPLDNWAVWLTYIGMPFHENMRELVNEGNGFEEENIGANRIQLLMQCLCLRRMKLQVDVKTNKTMIELPPKFETIRWLVLSPKERSLYQKAESIARGKYEEMAASGTIMQNYIHILKIILRLRQLCTHPKLWSEVQHSESYVNASTVDSRPTSQPSLKTQNPNDEGHDNPSSGNAMREADVPSNPNIVRACDIWKLHVRESGQVVKCDMCRGSIIPQSVRLADYSNADYPGPAITKCGHLICRLCQTVLIGFAPINQKDEKRLNEEVNVLAECVLCDELLEAKDITRIPTSVLCTLVKQDANTEEADTLDKSKDTDLGSNIAETQLSDQTLTEDSDKDLGSIESSTKIVSLFKDLDKIRNGQWIDDPEFNVDKSNPHVIKHQKELRQGGSVREKSVVFSQWTSMLDLIEPHLNERKIKFARLDGTMPRMVRNRNLERFKNNPNTEVLLLSLRAGGVGLNLVHASHVFMMDAFWNPSIERQAIDRVHRLGQTKPVSVTRYFVKDSIEERILNLQKRKAKIMDISLMDSRRETSCQSDESGSGISTDTDTLAVSSVPQSRKERIDDLNILLG